MPGELWKALRGSEGFLAVEGLDGVHQGGRAEGKKEGRGGLRRGIGERKDPDRENSAWREQAEREGLAPARSLEHLGRDLG